MPSFSDLISSTRNEMMTGWPDRINVLSADLTVSATSFSLTHPIQGVSPGARVSVGLEDMYVVSVSGQSLTVIRGFAGSTPAAHTDGDLVYLSPSFSDFQISQKVNEALKSLSSEGLFRVATAQFDYDPTRRGYDLDVDGLLKVLYVSYDDPTPYTEWRKWRSRDWYVDVDADPADFPSGQKIVLRQPAYPGFGVRVVCATEYSPLSSLSDDVETVSGLQPSAHDLPVLYAASRLQTGREVKRSLLNRQPDARRAEEVPPGVAQLSEQALLDAYKRRVRIEADRLTQRYRMSTG